MSSSPENNNKSSGLKAKDTDAKVLDVLGRALALPLLIAGLVGLLAASRWIQTSHDSPLNQPSPGCVMVSLPESSLRVDEVCPRDAIYGEVVSAAAPADAPNNPRAESCIVATSHKTSHSLSGPVRVPVQVCSRDVVFGAIVKAPKIDD